MEKNRRRRRRIDSLIYSCYRAGPDRVAFVLVTDRMESIFRLLLHKLNLVQGDHSDLKLLTYIDFHRRDLATTLETAKWQLEDFQRAVSLSATTEKSQMKEDVISRHRQFIRAIREQIVHVEKGLEDSSLGNPMRNNEWVNLNEE